MATGVSLESSLPKNWLFRKIDPLQVQSLQKEFDLLPLVARLVAGRDLPDSEAVRAFLKPTLASLHDPFLMCDMQRAVDRIVSAINQKEKIAVYGDYDVDGLTATTVLIRAFRWLNIDAISYIPHRLNEGYGLSDKGIEHLHSLGVTLIITVDNGISGHAEIEHAASLGIDVVVTDHHQPGHDLPRAVAVVNPNRADCPYPFKGLSGVGVAFKLVHALAKTLDQPPEKARAFLKSLMDLVALGTIADIVPLLGENRVLALHGLAALSNTDKTGLQAMNQMLGIDGKPMSGNSVGFLIGPRLNAAGRTDDANYGLRLLLSDDAHESMQLARFLDGLNDQRRRLEVEVLREAMETIEKSPAMLESPVLVVDGPGWHIGILGIVASRLVEKYYRPVIVLSTDEGIAKGSARSTPALDMYNLLHSCASLLTAYGGHPMAAGLSLAVDQIGAFREMANHSAQSLMLLERAQPELMIDTSARIEDFTLETMEQLEVLQPFGEANPAPTIALLDCELLEPPRVMKEKHLRLRLGQASAKGQSISAVGFGIAPQCAGILSCGDHVDIAGSLSVNEWNGRKSVELMITDIRACKE